MQIIIYQLTEIAARLGLVFGSLSLPAHASVARHLNAALTELNEAIREAKQLKP